MYGTTSIEHFIKKLEVVDKQLIQIGISAELLLKYLNIKMDQLGPKA